MMDEEYLDEEFTLGDGDAVEEGEVTCPYCGEVCEITLDPGSGTLQEYVEDCPVCCRPWRLTVAYQADGSAEIGVEREDE